MVAVAPAKAPPTNASGGFSGFAPFSVANFLNSPSAANCTAVYGTHRNSAGTVPAHNPRRPSSLIITRAHCVMLRYFPRVAKPRALTGSTCTCMRILITSNGATTTRLSIPANAPAIMECFTDVPCDADVLTPAPPIVRVVSRSSLPPPAAACALRLGLSAVADATKPALPTPSARSRLLRETARP
eukprot:CAMPEP_0117629934 /NCGR_PEP_ID=MMETSP0802-20121206/3235_1 /TAXON_ID=38833 /ORGANISM="Micromonas sp., Strain CCMP2099" /LENGTH=185 /DNA_ID=CAMNT_0005434187 /DNA_START=548 /DNA_END=1102 /DNA_ORIENTATION=-